MKSMVNLLDDMAQPSNARRGWRKPLVLQGNLHCGPMIENQRRNALALADIAMTGRLADGEGTGLFGDAGQGEAGGTGGAAGRQGGRTARAAPRCPSPEGPLPPCIGARLRTPIAFFAFSVRQVVGSAPNVDAVEGSGGVRGCNARLVGFLPGLGCGSIVDHVDRAFVRRLKPPRARGESGPRLCAAARAAAGAGQSWTGAGGQARAACLPSGGWIAAGDRV